MIKKATLIKENNKLKRKIFILENIGVTINSTIREKEEATKIFLEKYTDYTMYEVCSTIKLSKGTYYNYIHYKVDKPWFIEREEFLTKEIIEIFNNSKKLYGIERIQIALNNKGITAAINTISKIMKKNNLIPVSFNKRKRVFKYQTKEEKELNLVNRKFNQPRPNMVWVSDFLEIKSQNKKYYLCCIMDLYARKIVSYEINEKLNIKLALDCLSKAYKSRCINEELIIHTDWISIATGIL